MQGEPTWLSNLTNKQQVLFKGTKIGRLENFEVFETTTTLKAILQTDQSRAIGLLKGKKTYQ